MALFFLGTYLRALAAIWACFYDRLWQVFVHAAFVSAGAHMLLQGALMLCPQLPFAREPKRPRTRVARSGGSWSGLSSPRSAR